MSKLHKVVYGKTVDEVLSAYQRSYQDHLVDEWLKQNCKRKYYRNPGWTTEKFIEFEDSRDAILFSLRWGR